ncbi:MAG TPA: sulfate ABC transporter substrate-binding protein [Gaiellaceae bacterium]|nr:sulfate ABC transporter substrate-binding protein [Gaiellaceae bacterium]
MRRLLLFALILPVVFGSASGAAEARQSGTTVHLVAYSTPQPIMAKLITRFQHQPAGQGVSFSQSYGSSGSQARAIVAGQPADIAFLSTGLDIDTVADAGIISKTWTHAPQGGIAADSVVAFVVRPGNPKHIHTWKDLTKPGVKVVTPDPFPSGSAKWNVLAAYGQARKSGLSDKQAVQFVTKLFKNVVAQPSSGSSAASAFFSGEGDVLITYESEAYSAFAAGKQGKLVVPKPTMLIQLPMVATKSAPGAAKAFIKYVHSPKQQKIFAANGYRPVIKSVLKSSDLAGWKKKYNTGPTFKIQDKIFGGWLKVNRVWFNPDNGKMVKIERAVGGPTS